MMWNIFLSCCMLLSVFVTSEKISGTLDTTGSKEDWIFLTRFCFLSNNGKFSFRVSYPQTYTSMKILLYFDEADQWQAVYKNDSKSCLEKTSSPHIVTQRNQDIVLKPGLQYYWSGCDYMTDTKDSTQLIKCEASRTFRSSRERWWYIAVSNCGDDKGIYMDYELNLTNGNSDELFKYHFSADEMGILETNLSFFLLMLNISVITIVCAVLLHKKKFLHTTYKLYMASVFIKTAAMFFLTVSYGVYANNGDPNRLYVVSCIGRFFGVVAYIIFVLLIILIGKGYTVTRGKLRLHSEIVITVFLTVYSIAILMLYLVEFTLFDPGEVLYIYDFYFGIGLILLPALAFFWLIYAVFFTLKHYPEKWKFYIPFVVFYGFWFLCLPIIVITSNLLIPKYMKEKVVNGVEMGVSFLGYAVFLLLTLPCCVDLVFPFHVRTNKIDVIDNAPHDTGRGGAASTYAVPNPTPSTTYTVSRETVTIHNPGTTPIAPNLAALFIVQNTHSAGAQGGNMYQTEPTNEKKGAQGGKKYQSEPTYEKDEPPPEYTELLEEPVSVVRGLRNLHYQHFS